MPKNLLAKSGREIARRADPGQVGAALQDDLHMHADDIHGAVYQPVQQEAEPNADAAAAAKQVVVQDPQSNARDGHEVYGDARAFERYFEHPHDDSSNSLEPDER